MNYYRVNGEKWTKLKFVQCNFAWCIVSWPSEPRIWSKWPPRKNWPNESLDTLNTPIFITGVESILGVRFFSKGRFHHYNRLDNGYKSSGMIWKNEGTWTSFRLIMLCFLLYLQSSTRIPILKVAKFCKFVGRSIFMEGKFDNCYGTYDHWTIHESKENSMNFDLAAFSLFYLPPHTRNRWLKFCILFGSSCIWHNKISDDIWIRN